MTITQMETAIRELVGLIGFLAPFAIRKLKEEGETEIARQLRDSWREVLRVVA